jgi:glycosyltransferase involved in cell wall biosynthesis
MTTIPLRLPYARRSIVAFNEKQFSRAIESNFPSRGGYDFAYAHFLPAGRAALEVCEPRGVPVFLSLGESDPWDYDEHYHKDEWIVGLERFAGIFTASKRNRQFLLERNPRLRDRIDYIPNGVDTSRFKPVSMRECRDRLGFPQDLKIALFCGHFDHRKGPLRVLEAVRMLGVHGIFLGGNGPDHPEGSEVLFAGPVQNSDLPLWLGAADVFVLPSLSEGMSNAMLEALACGLPLVVADLDFNRDFLDDASAQFIDPLDVEAIASAIQYCMDPLNNARMRSQCRAQSEQFSVTQRVSRVMKFVACRAGRLTADSAP